MTNSHAPPSFLTMMHFSLYPPTTSTLSLSSQAIYRNHQHVSVDSSVQLYIHAFWLCTSNKRKHFANFCIYAKISCFTVNTIHWYSYRSRQRLTFCSFIYCICLLFFKKMSVWSLCKSVCLHAGRVIIMAIECVFLSAIMNHE